MGPFLFASIRRSLLLVVLLAVLPALAIVLYTGYELRDSVVGRLGVVLLVLGVLGAGIGAVGIDGMRAINQDLNLVFDRNVRAVVDLATLVELSDEIARQVDLMEGEMLRGLLPMTLNDRLGLIEGRRKAFTILWETYLKGDHSPAEKELQRRMRDSWDALWKEGVPEALDLARNLVKRAHELRRAAGFQIYDLARGKLRMRARKRVEEHGSVRMQALQRLVCAALQRALFRHAFVPLQHGLYALGKAHLLRTQRFIDEQCLVYHEDCVLAQIVQQRFGLFIKKRQQHVSADARDSFAPGILLVTQTRPARDALEGFLREFPGLRRLQRGADQHALHLLHAALADRVKCAHLVDFVAEELNSHGVFFARRKYVHQVSARGALSAPFHQLHALIARGNQPLDERSRFQRVADRDRNLAVCKRASWGERLHERGRARGDNARFPFQQSAQRGDARAAVFAGGRVYIDQRRFARQKQLGSHAKEPRTFVELRRGHVRRGHKQHLPCARERGAE
ncbi:MAG: hypothetical protein EOM69_10355, partial [Clostridia bacterium]|nr:hypothetical protein [Clostridia bacterium]